MAELLPNYDIYYCISEYIDIYSEKIISISCKDYNNYVNSNLKKLLDKLDFNHNTKLLWNFYNMNYINSNGIINRKTKYKYFYDILYNISPKYTKYEINNSTTPLNNVDEKYIKLCIRDKDINKYKINNNISFETYIAGIPFIDLNKVSASSVCFETLVFADLILNIKLKTDTSAKYVGKYDNIKSDAVVFPPTCNFLVISKKYVKNVCGGRKLDNNRYYNKLFIDLIEI